MAYVFNPVFKALSAQIPCAVCGEANERVEFYKIDNRPKGPVGYQYSLYPRQSSIETAYRALDTVPVCGPCFRAGVSDWDALKKLTRDDLDALSILIRTTRMSFRDYRKAHYPNF
jgi:hypothetical protein